MGLLDPVTDCFDGLLAWLGSSLGQLCETRCLLESADDAHTLAGKDGSLVSIIKITGVTYLVGPEEFDRIHKGLAAALRTALAQSGHVVQVFFKHDKGPVAEDLQEILTPARQTADKLNLDLEDLFKERVDFLTRYCASEEMYLVLWTCPGSMTQTQMKQAIKNKAALQKKGKMPKLRNAQNFLIGIPELRDTHHSFCKVLLDDIQNLGFASELLEVHEACYHIRKNIDPDFTDSNWRPYLPGDRIPVRETKHFKEEISEVLWPILSAQLIPRDAEIQDLRTVRIGDRYYGTVYIDLFPKDIAPFITLFRRIMHTQIPWRVSFLLESGGMGSLGLKPVLSSILSFASNNNKLISNGIDYLNYLSNNTDEAIVKFRVCASTWAPASESTNLIKTRLAELAKAIQGWGHCETSEVSGDAFAGALSSTLGLNIDSVANPSIAPLNDVVYMLPLTRPASPWEKGAVLFRSYDGKPWPYQPGSTLQTTWIDIVYARPGSGKSVLSNSINLALCLSAGLIRLPRISIIDIGPSSSGLISLLKEALPPKDKHLVAYHRLRMVKEMSINPFDTQLGCRYPSAQDRAFLVNFLTLLATPVGESRAYDGISDMAGLIVDEMYKVLADDGNPHPYCNNLEPVIDEKISALKMTIDEKTSWWEVVDELFKNNEVHLATIAQRYAMPLLADAASICRAPAIADLYGEIKAPTGEPIINSFGRMISGAVREYPILSRVTSFDLGEARVISLDLDEVAKSGGEAADRQTAVMYMLARYVLARHFYLTEDNVKDLSEGYRNFHLQRIKEIRDDPKRIVFDEFHRTSKAQAVRDQVIVDMREGRKWKVQVALLSQSIDDFDPVMIEFATAIFIMDAGPKQSIEKSAKIFGLSPTAKLALENRVHGPRADGATFLAQFATKGGVNTQLLTSTIGPIELWSFNTTAEDVRIRNTLYDRIGAIPARKILAKMFPSGSAAKVVEERLTAVVPEGEYVSEKQNLSIIDKLVEEILDTYHKSPELQN